VDGLWMACVLRNNFITEGAIKAGPPFSGPINQKFDLSAAVADTIL
jgi:hypothetical protein